jgi:hypothetical protein
MIGGPCNLAMAQGLKEKAVANVQPSYLIEKPELPRTTGNMLEPQPEIFFCTSAEASCRSNADSFSIDETLDLFVFVTLPGVSGKHLETVEFVLPDGEIYERRKTLFQIDNATLTLAPSGNARAAVVVPQAEAPHLIANANIQHEAGIPSLLTTSRAEPTLLTVLPIAGTYITQRALTGIWQVRVLLDDQLIVAVTVELRSNASAPNAEDQEAGEKGDVRARSPKS